MTKSLKPRRSRRTQKNVRRTRGKTRKRTTKRLKRRNTLRKIKQRKRLKKTNHMRGGKLRWWSTSHTDTTRGQDNLLLQPDSTVFNITACLDDPSRQATVDVNYNSNTAEYEQYMNSIVLEHYKMSGQGDVVDEGYLPDSEGVVKGYSFFNTICCNLFRRTSTVSAGSEISSRESRKEGPTEGLMDSSMFTLHTSVFIVSLSKLFSHTRYYYTIIDPTGGRKDTTFVVLFGYADVQPHLADHRKARSIMYALFYNDVRAPIAEDTQTTGMVDPELSMRKVLNETLEISETKFNILA